MSAVADAARPLLAGYLEPENWAALRAAVEAEGDATAVVLPAEDWADVVWLLDKFARDYELSMTSRRRAAIVCDRIGRQTRPDPDGWARSVFPAKPGEATHDLTTDLCECGHEWGVHLIDTSLRHVCVPDCLCAAYRPPSPQPEPTVDVAAVVAGHTAPVVARLHEAEVPS